jgi:hypothetical protein
MGKWGNGAMVQLFVSDCEQDLIVWGSSAMVQLFVHCVTSAVLGEGVEMDVSCFTCP